MTRKYALLVITAAWLIFALGMLELRLVLDADLSQSIYLLAALSATTIGFWVIDYFVLSSRWISLVWYGVNFYLIELFTHSDMTMLVIVLPFLGVLYRRRRLAVLGTVVALVVVLASLSRRYVPFSDEFWLHAGSDGLVIILMASVSAVILRYIVQQERQLVDQAVAAEHLMTQRMAHQWALAVDARSPYTGGHVERVTEYAGILFSQVPHTHMDADRFRLACLLHDVGKITVPDAVLNKPSKLTAPEYELIKSHAIKGWALVKETGATDDIAGVVRSHHERWDGCGYPDGLKGAQIPLEARILAIADAFDAMTSDRPYRAAMHPTEASEEIRRSFGTQFDPSLSAPFEAAIPTWTTKWSQMRTLTT